VIDNPPGGHPSRPFQEVGIMSKAHDPVTERMTSRYIIINYLEDHASTLSRENS
jgi:hypothetical protein